MDDHTECKDLEGQIKMGDPLQLKGLKEEVRKKR
jgi:hypothetical protein